MRKLVVSMFLTLDGVMQAPGGPDEDPSGGFTHGGWSGQFWNEQLDQEMTKFMAHPFELLLGRKTYEIFAGYWPTSTEPGAEQLNSARKHVASRTLRSAEWNNSTVIKGDVSAYVADLKKQSGPEIQVYGSGDLIQTLLKEDLVDEFHLMIFPIVLGGGKRLFAKGTVPAAFKVADARPTTSGVIIATYRRAGDVKIASAQDLEAEAEVGG